MNVIYTHCLILFFIELRWKKNDLTRTIACHSITVQDMVIIATAFIATRKVSTPLGAATVVVQTFVNI